MKRSVLLIVLLFLVALTWGGLRLKDRQWHQWLATARRDELEKYVADHRDQTEALVHLAILLRNAGERERAETLVRHAVEVAPNEETNWVEFSRTLTDDQEAIRGLEGFLKVMPDSAPVMAELGRHYLQIGDAATARTLAEKATKATPESPDAWRLQGDVMVALRQMPEAEKAFRKALSLRDDTETRLSLARLLIPLQRYPEIISLCSPMVKAGHSPAISPEQRARALLYTAGGRLYDSLTPAEIALLQAQLHEADSLSAKLPMGERFLPTYFLGESFLRLNKPAEAIPYLKRSMEAGPMFAGSLYSLARAYRFVGETAQADAISTRHTRLSRILGELEMYNNRLQQRPDDAETMLKLAGVLAEAGSVREARQLYERLLAQGKLVETAQRRLKELPSTP